MLPEDLVTCVGGMDYTRCPVWEEKTCAALCSVTRGCDLWQLVSSFETHPPAPVPAPLAAVPGGITKLDSNPILYIVDEFVKIGFIRFQLVQTFFRESSDAILHVCVFERTFWPRAPVPVVL